MSLSSTRSNTIYQMRNPYGDPFSYNYEINPQLEIIGLVLWLAEGDKTQLSLANGNSKIIVQYLAFLRTICNFQEDKIKAVIHCHNTLTYQQCLEYWSVLTHIPSDRFNSPHVKQDRGGRRKYPYGILRIVACNVKLIRIFNERLKTLGLN